MKILWISSSVVPYSEKSEFSHVATTNFLKLIINELNKLNILNEILVSNDSDSSFEKLIKIKGNKTPTLANNKELINNGIVIESLLSNMIDYAYENQKSYDFIINIGHDWLPYFMMNKFDKNKFICFPNLVKTSEILNDEINKKSITNFNQIIYSSKYQRMVLGNDNNKVIYQGFDLNNFKEYESINEKYLLFAARINKFKGLENALLLSEKINIPIYVCGPIEDINYFNLMKNKYSFNYLGVLDRFSLYKYMKSAYCFLQLQTSDWQEAFGRTTVESMLNGTPIIYNDNGANKELINLCDAGFMYNINYSKTQILEKINKYNNKSKNIKKNALNYFNINNTSKQLLEHLKKL